MARWTAHQPRASLPASRAPTCRQVCPPHSQVQRPACLALRTPSARPPHAHLTTALILAGEAKKKTGGRGTEGVFDESSGRGRTNANQKMEAAEAREAYEGLNMGGSKWGKDKDKGKAGAASASDPALCARVDKLVSEQHNLVSEVSDLRGSIALIEQLLRQALPLSGAAAPQGRVALQPRRHSAAGGSEASTRQLLAAAAGTSAAGGVPPPLQAAALPPARPLNNLEA